MTTRTSNNLCEWSWQEYLLSQIKTGDWVSHSPLHSEQHEQQLVRGHFSSRARGSTPDKTRDMPK